MKEVSQLWGDALRYFKGVRAELTRVVWPKTDEFIGSTIIVLMLVAVFAVFLYCVDYMLHWLIVEQVLARFN